MIGQPVEVILAKGEPGPDGTRGGGGTFRGRLLAVDGLMNMALAQATYIADPADGGHTLRFDSVVVRGDRVVFFGARSA